MLWHLRCRRERLRRRPRLDLRWDVHRRFKPQHFAGIFRTQPDSSFFEVHAENYMDRARLAALRMDIALSIHCVGLSIGGPDPFTATTSPASAPSETDTRPESLSEPVAGSGHDGTYLSNLLLPPHRGEGRSAAKDENYRNRRQAA